MPPKNKRSAEKYAEDDFVAEDEGAAPTTKRAKATTSKSTPTKPPSGKAEKDEEGNTYWELGGRLRRVTLSEFKGKKYVNIREHYEKDGKVLPGKKGISLSIDQFNALLTVLPQMTEHLESEGIDVVRPSFAGGSLEKKGEPAGQEKEDASPAPKSEAESDEDEK